MKEKYLMHRPDLGFAKYDQSSRLFEYVQEVSAAHEASKEDWDKAISEGYDQRRPTDIVLLPAPVYVDRLEAALSRNNVMMTEASDKIAELQNAVLRHENWLIKSKEESGYPRNVSFDVVWDDMLKLRGVIGHVFVHSGYRDCGFVQMTTDEKRLFVKILDQFELFHSAEKLREKII